MGSINSFDVAATAGRQVALHESAAAIARKHFGRQIFVRGVVEVSNFCRENCNYCGMRRDNRTLMRTRARLEELAELIVHKRPVSVTDINIQSGEDPVAVREIVLPLIKILRKETPLGISVCLGALDYSLYDEMRKAGAGLYILKFESSRELRYAQLQAPGTLRERLHHIRWLAAHGWTVTSGFISGLPSQPVEELAENCEFASDLPLVGCSVSPFIPGESTPLGAAARGDVNLALNCMARLRVTHPNWLIPAVSALNLAESGNGYRRGLRAGANVVTINLTPPDLRKEYIIYKRDRFIVDEDCVLSAISEEGLTPSKKGMVEYSFKPVAEELVPNL